MASKTCAICGKPSGMYPLCKDCFKLRDEGKIEQCPDCKTWHYTNKPCECKKAAKKSNKEIQNPEKTSKSIDIPPCFKYEQNEVSNYETCIICGNPSNKKPQCKDCYNETKNHMGSLDKNSSVRKLRDYYYNLKERILIIKSLEEAKNQCNKLISIAMLEENINNDTSLLDRVYKDVENLIKGKQAPVQNPIFEEERKEKDEHKSKINTAQDGHNVDSDMEVRIDDTLYNAFILHCYGKTLMKLPKKEKNATGLYLFQTEKVFILNTGE